MKIEFKFFLKQEDHYKPMTVRYFSQLLSCIKRLSSICTYAPGRLCFQLICVVLAITTQVAFSQDNKIDASIKKANVLEFQNVFLESQPQTLVDFTFLPNQNEFLAVSHDGLVHHYSIKGELLNRFIFPVFQEKECGSYSIIVDPDFANNNFFYMAYCASLNRTIVSRFTWSDDVSNIFKSETEIVAIHEPRHANSKHRVGSIGFDNQGNLWVGFGDHDVHVNAQETSNFQGSLIRLNPSRTARPGYRTPSDNPFVRNSKIQDEIIAYGLRNPFRIAFHDDVWFIADVGSRDEKQREELNVLIGPRGSNFGWDKTEGRCHKKCQGIEDPHIVYRGSNFGWDKTEGRCHKKCRGVEDPHIVYDQYAEEFTRQDPQGTFGHTGAAIGGLIFYSSKNVVEDPYHGLLDSRIVYVDIYKGFVRGAIFQKDSGTLKDDRHLGHLQMITSMRIHPGGFIYACTLFGDFYRVSLNKVQEVSATNSNLHENESFTELFIKLRDTSAPVRMDGLQTLLRRELTNSDFVPNVVPLLNDSNRMVRVWAIQVLSKLKGDIAARALIQILPESDPMLQLSIIKALGEMKSPKAFDVLAQMLFETTTSAIAQVSLISALIEIDEHQSLDLLKRLLNVSKDPALLNHLVGFVVTSNEITNTEKKKLLFALGNETSSGLVRVKIVEGLRSIGFNNTVKVWFEFAKSVKDSMVSVVIIDDLPDLQKQYPDTDMVSIMMELAVLTPTLEVQYRAARKLRAIGTETTATALLDLTWEIPFEHRDYAFEQFQYTNPSYFLKIHAKLLKFWTSALKTLDSYNIF